MAEVDAVSDVNWAQWLSTKPSHVRRIGAQHPCWHNGKLVCYRLLNGASSHVTIGAYSDDESILVLHGKDSQYAGTQEIVLSDQLVRCSCGRWQHATMEQELARRAIDARA